MSDPPPVPYAGIASRALALAIDAAIAQLIVLTGGAVIALVGSLVGGLDFDTAGRILAAVAWTGVVGTYFVVFWSTTGQTPGMRMLGLRVTRADGTRLGVGRAIVRVVGLALAIIPFFAGFLPVLVDDRRRGIHDMLADTVVRYAVAAPQPQAEIRATTTPAAPR
jgi:uncharacterized RDD family membrane protein YckC